MQTGREIAMLLLVVGLIALSTGCSKSDFIKNPFSEKDSAPTAAVNVQVTPRELLTARLINPPPDDNTPRITVGKLIEFADRYLSCDCSGTRFVKAWQRLPGGGYRLQTNSAAIHPLDFACKTDGEVTNCYLAEIDRGAQVSELEKRFVPGAEFIQFMYENGLKCEREGPCPANEPAS